MARQGITGHSMGGHGALTVALRHPGRFRSVSAFAPIVAPSQVPWGEKALAGYLGPDRAAWRAHDAVALIEDGARVAELLVDLGEADPFLDERASGPSCSSGLRRRRHPADAAAPAGLRPQLLFHLDLHGRPSALARGAAERSLAPDFCHQFKGACPRPPIFLVTPTGIEPVFQP